MKILILFIIISAVNVILSTTRQLLTVKGSKWIAALACAVYNAFNNILSIISPPLHYTIKKLKKKEYI